MGNCSCGIAQNDIDKEFQMPKKEEKINEETILKEIRTRFEQPMSSLETINPEEFDKKLYSFPNVKELFKEYESQISEQSSKNVPTLNPAINLDSEDKFIELPKPVKYSDEDGNFELFKGSVNKNFDLTGKGYQITNDYLYYGNFQNNKFNGKGLMINENGSSLFGDWINGACTGKGKLIINDKLEYEGDFVNNIRQGYGIEKYPDGSIYEGEFQDGKKNGKGKCKISKGETYEGEFKDDLFNGEGIYKWSLEQREYIGHFENGNMDGKGINKFKDGSVYEGNYKNGLKNGYGKYSWPNGKVFYGSWLNNKLHGNGYYEIDNVKYNITFRFGKIISTQRADDSDENKRIKFGIDNIVDKEKIDNSEKYVCSICNNVLNQPHECNNCLKNFCVDCIKDGNDNKKCPNCGGTNYQNNLHLLQELIATVKVKCNDCQNILDYKSSLNHYHS